MSNNKQITNQSKIVKYKLEQDCVNLKKQNLSYEKIAEELNASGKVPHDDLIDKFVVMRFLKQMPEITREVVQGNKHRLMEVVNTNLDIIHEVNSMFLKTKSILENMEQDAVDKQKSINPYAWKAVVSEMREMLKQMGDIQKEINDYDNIRKFMEIVINTLHEECPEKIPVIANKLKLAKNTQWFADILNRSK